jgi:flagellar M-ring protein FliF
MDYNHTSETSEKYDPDSKVVRSTQTVEQNATDTTGNGNAVSVSNSLPGQQASGGNDNVKSNSGHTEETTNYEINKTVTTSTVDAGSVKKLSVAVVVDGIVGENGSYKPRSAQDLKEIDTLVKSAIGYDASRGDQVQVVNMPFARIDTGPATPAPAPLLGLDGADWFKIIEAAILSITALLIGLFVMRPLISRMFAPVSYSVTHSQIAPGSPVAGQLAPPAGQGADAAAQAGQSPTLIPPPRESMIDISRIEGQVRESSVKKVGEVVQAHPEEALAIMRTWLHEPV